MSKLKWSEYDFTKIPFNDIVKVGQRNLLYRDIFTVSWLLGRFCNYRCSYCWPYARSDKKDHRPTELCLKTIDEIKRQARQNGFNSFHFSLSGGEPTFHPGYLDILKYLADDVPNTNYTSIHMTSNCSRPIKWFQTYVDYAKPFHRASITASLHTEHVNTPQKMQDLADKLVLCQEHDVQVTINMVMVPDKFDEYTKWMRIYEKEILTATNNYDAQSYVFFFEEFGSYITCFLNFSNKFIFLTSFLKWEPTRMIYVSIYKSIVNLIWCNIV